MSLIIVSNESAQAEIVFANSFCSASKLESKSRWVIPTIPFIGVRISWLMLARNSDFSRAASTAESRDAFIWPRSMAYLIERSRTDVVISLLIR